MQCHIDQKKSKELGGLAVHLQGTARNELEKEVLKFVKPFKKGDDFSCLPRKNVFEFITLMTRSGILFFDNKEIVVDLYGKVALSIQVGEEVVGVVHYKDQTFFLHDVDFIFPGPPHWFIMGRSLRFVSTEISASEVGRLFEKSLRIDEIDEDEVPVEFLGCAKEIFLLEKEPLPILYLQDRSGGFANLFMDYGKYIVSYHDCQEALLKLVDSQFLALQNKEVVKEGQCFKEIGRNRQVEKGWHQDLLETDFIEKRVGTTFYYCPMDCVSKSLSFLLELGWTLLDESGRRVVRSSNQMLDIKESVDGIRISGAIDYEQHKTDLADVMGTFNRNERFVSLSLNEVGFISEELTSSVLKPFIDEGEMVDGEIEVKRPFVMGLVESIREPALKERLRQFSPIRLALPTSSFCGQLRPYQQEGVNWLSFLYHNHFHGLLADEMGLGKTVQVIAFLSQILEDGSSPILIAMPTSLIFNWKLELERFLPKVTIGLYYGDKRSQVLKDKCQILLTSYAILRLDNDELSKILFDCVIFDEAQAIKNANTQIAKSALRLNARFRLSITGTPVENHIGELHSHFHFLIPGLLTHEMTEVGIKKKIRPFLLRRTKDQVVKDLPEKIEQVIFVDMAIEQKTLYEQLLVRFKSNLLQKVNRDGVGKHRIEIFESILRLRQICCHPLLCSSLFPSDSVFSSSKMEAVIEDLKSHVEEGHKVLIYSQFTSFLQLFLKEARSRDWCFAYLDGSTKNREEVVLSFQNNPKILLFFMSLKAGGVGLNLTCADYVYILDPWWNEAVESQAINRAHRIGRRDVVIAKRYVTSESIEEKMLKLKSKKKRVADQLIEGDVEVSFTQEDLYYLFE